MPVVDLCQAVVLQLPSPSMLQIAHIVDCFQGVSASWRVAVARPTALHGYACKPRSYSNHIPVESHWLLPGFSGCSRQGVPQSVL